MPPPKPQKEAQGRGAGKRAPAARAETAAQRDATVATQQPFTSWDLFLLCIDRAKNLLKLHQAAHGKRAKPERYMADAHRAAMLAA